MISEYSAGYVITSPHYSDGAAATSVGSREDRIAGSLFVLHSVIVQLRVGCDFSGRRCAPS